MSFQEDPTVFFNDEGPTVSVVLTKADESATVTTRGIVEDAVLGEETTYRAERASFQPQVTVSYADGSPYSEGDSAEYIPPGRVASETFTIVDSYEDGIQVTLTLIQS